MDIIKKTNYRKIFQILEKEKIPFAIRVSFGVPTIKKIQHEQKKAELTGYSILIPKLENIKRYFGLGFQLNDDYPDKLLEKSLYVEFYNDAKNYIKENNFVLEFKNSGNEVYSSKQNSLKEYFQKK